MTGLELADVDTVLVRCPRATRASVQAVLDALRPALGYAAAGADLEALMALNRPLMDFQPMDDLLAWFDPVVINDALSRWRDGDRKTLPVMLRLFGVAVDDAPPWALEELRREGIR